MAVDRLIATVRDHTSSTLVVRGEPGAGKSALLRHAASQASGMTVLRAGGVEAELELPFAAVHALVRPVLSHVEALPPPQATALRTAMGLETGEHDRFLVSVGLLSLLAEVAEHKPLLVLIDDAHWLDRASADALVFTARRLQAEPIGMLFAVREGETRRFGSDGLPELRLRGLDADPATALLLERLPEDAPPHIRRRLVELTGGNPLALLELPAALSSQQLRGHAPLPDPLPVSHEVERAFLYRVRTLPAASRMLLLLAAADDLGQVDVILRAAAALGLRSAALADAEAAGLVAVESGGLRFRHPLVRSAIYKAASGEQRRAVHSALADALHSEADVDRRAWHRALATLGRDREAADLLERSAKRARERSGYAIAATALERAADLTPDRHDAARRLIAAADAAWNAGQSQRVGALLDRAAPLADDAATSADIQLLQGQRERSDGTMGRAYDILASGAERIASTDARRAVAMLTGAGLAAWGRNDRIRLQHAADRIGALGFDEATPAGLAAQLVRAFASIVRGDAASAVPPIARAVTAAEHAGQPYALAMAGAAASFVGDDTGSLRLFGRAVAAARAQGAVAVLVNMLAAYATVEAWAGRVRSAMAHATEGLALAEQTAHRTYLSIYQAALAWMHAEAGDTDECGRLATAAVRAGMEVEFSPTIAMATWAMGLNALGSGRPDEAHAQLAELVRGDSLTSHPTIAVAATGDVVEAAVETGNMTTAHDAVEALARFANDTSARWALAVAARCRGLIADTGDVDGHFTEALAHHAHATRPFEHARTLLSYGAWLRRQRRRMDARQHLRAALQIFERLGSSNWERRASAELRASGETVRRPEPGHVRRLTPQELQIVQIVRTGATNKQIAAQLYLSPRTIDYHLRKVFAKLGLSSRAELITLAADDVELDAPV